MSSHRLAKIKWHCRRGMLELDLFLAPVAQQLEQFSEQQLMDLERLLNEADPDLYAWFMGYESPSTKELQSIVAFIRDQAQPSL